MSGDVGGARVVEAVVVGVIKEEEVGKIVVGVETAASIVVEGNVAIDIHPAVHIGFALLLLVLSSSLARSPLYVSSRPSPPLSPLSFLLSGYSRESELSSSSSLTEFRFCGCFCAGLGVPSGSVARWVSMVVQALGKSMVALHQALWVRLTWWFELWVSLFVKRCGVWRRLDDGQDH